MKAGSYVKLTVSDTGTGIDPEIQSRLFEPFFTTKPPGYGTGLGLSTVYGIVKQSGGYIWVQSKPGEGAAFEIYLPQAVTEAKQPAAAAAPKTRTRGSETILLVEDDSGVRKLAATILTTHGYKVLEASRASEAESISHGYAGELDLVLTDMVMPDASGDDIAERIRRQRPNVRVLFMSGYSAGTHSWRPGDHATEEILQKPFTSASLTQWVRQRLDAPAVQVQE
jgi:CheY-like chemotaxis protein